MFVDCLKAFMVGGFLCLIGQILIDYTKLTPARILTGFVVAGVLLSGLGLYEPLIEFAGGGATVPLTGFGHLLADGIRKAVAEKGNGGSVHPPGGCRSAEKIGEDRYAGCSHGAARWQNCYRSHLRT